MLGFDKVFFYKHLIFSAVILIQELKLSMKGINEEIESLWEDYVEASLEELSQDALDLRGELMSAFGGETSDAKT